MIEVDKSLYGKNLKRLMAKRSMSIERLHDISGLGTTSISSYRASKVLPTADKIQIIAKALRFEVGEFFKEEQKNESN